MHFFSEECATIQAVNAVFIKTGVKGRMDGRKALPPGFVLDFPGMRCVVVEEVGRGSNAIVYRGRYADTFHEQLNHSVLVKELFPLHPRGAIYRDESNSIVCKPEGKALWNVHRSSFEGGNQAHLALMEADPDQIGSNLNTYQLNQTLYTVMGLNGGASLESQSQGEAEDLRQVTVRMLNVLDALAAFHHHGLLHLDIAPDNILLVGSGSRERAMLIDFNSCASAQKSVRDAKFTASVKQGYTAPEAQSGNTDEIGFPTDLYAVTAVFYRLISGTPLTPFQMIRNQPPDISQCRCIQELPDTVRSWTRQILRHGLYTLPSRRYQSVEQMRDDFNELLNRIDGVGITHWALWEAGRRSVQRMIRENASLTYIEKDAELYPLRVKWKDSEKTVPLAEFMAELPKMEKYPVLLTGAGGMGKSTALLRTVITAPSVYSPDQAVMLYLPLSGWKPGDRHYIQDSILQHLRFDASTRTMEDARHALMNLLRGPQSDGASFLLLLDGLNETAGDAAELIQEMNALNDLPGLRMLVTSRTAQTELHAKRAEMTLLSPQDVNDALARRGLLVPEKPEMQHLLLNPMMLSLFIQTAQVKNSQVLCGTEQELLTSYLDALCAKISQESDVPSSRAEAAVWLVLPAIARKMKKQGGGMDDRTLMETVLKCRKLLDSRTLVHAFPHWIGHGNEITGGKAVNGDTWYGMIVQQLLWRQLGLLVRDDAGGYHIAHQIIQDDLAEKDALNCRAIWQARIRTEAIVVMIVVALLFSAQTGWVLFGKPKPYEEGTSEAVLKNAYMQYNSCVAQYDTMIAMLAGELEPSACESEVINSGAKEEGRVVKAARTQMETDKNRVVPWSQVRFDFEHYTALQELPAARGKEYQLFIRGYEHVINGKAEVPKEDYAENLLALLNVDQEIAELLCKLVCMPHMDVDWKTRSWVFIRENMSTAEILTWDLNIVAQNNAPEETRKLLLSALEIARQRRQEARDKMDYPFLNERQKIT